MTVTMRSVVVSGHLTGEALAELTAGLDDARPDFAWLFYSAIHDDTLISGFLRDRLPGVPVIGGTSSQGLVSMNGLSTEGPIGLLAVYDPDGRYGAASAPAGADPAATAERLLTEALAAADAEGELPELIFTYLSPGVEEQAIAGFQRLVGDRCPIIGGTAIDDGVHGHWRALGPGGCGQDTIAVAVLFPSGGIAFSFQGGYEPTGATGIITEVLVDGEVTDGPVRSHQIVSIDGRSAAEVYGEWRGRATVSGLSMEDRVVVEQTVRSPFGIVLGAAADISYYRLVQPGEVSPEGYVSTFAAVSPGERLCMMRGSVDGLVRRAGTVVGSAKTDLQTGDIAGGLVIYCAGCRLAVGDRIDEVVSTIQRGFAGRPFLSLFGGGEQGPILGHVIHSNLMISAIVLGS